MNYCRFQNTLKDLKQCNEDFDSPDLSVDEKEARKKLYTLCKRIVECFDIDELD